MKYKLNTHHRKLLVDTMTPVNMYLKIRDKFPNSILLESSDYGVNDNSVAYICFHSIADIKLQKQTLHYRYPDGSSREKSLAANEKVAKYISDFARNLMVISAAGVLFRMVCLASLPTRPFNILKTSH